MGTRTWDAWNYRESAEMDPGKTVVGFSVHAIDGHIGKVDGATMDVGDSHVVVDTGPWIFGKKVMLPAGVLKTVDHVDEKVFVNRTKDEIKNSPEFDDSMRNDEKYRAELGTYYGRGGRAYRDWD